MRSPKSSYLFVAPYLLLLLIVGLYPAGYAVYLALTSATAKFSGLKTFFGSYHDYRFLLAFGHLAVFLLIWLTALLGIVTGLALLLQNFGPRVGGTFRFLFFLPAALAGAGSVMLWLFLLQPGRSPWDFVLHWLGYKTLGQSLASENLPVVFALIAFWSGAGIWIVVMRAALGTIPNDVLEAATLDGASGWRTALYIKLPLMKKWIAYVAIFAFAAGLQLFAEPQLVSEATGGAVSQWWSPNQLAYYLAFYQDNFNYAAAISIELLMLALVCSSVLVLRTRAFRITE
jgi:multiple sugar transport system permease protein